MEIRNPIIKGAPIEVDAWVDVTQNAFRTGADIDLNKCDGTLYIDAALTDETAHTGTKLIAQISSAAVDNEFWLDYTTTTFATGTANLETITSSPLNAGDDSITCADTTGYTTAGWKFIKDTTIADSEMIYEISFSTNTSVKILDGVKRQHSSAMLSDVTAQWIVDLPETASRARIIYDNTNDPDGATIATRCRVSKRYSV